ncbi:hypothetical protein HGO21_16525 [Acinetobacter sp. CUI P1]|nr:hypothetical protein [Acinetobacter sp. CUI P1]
MYKYLFHVQPSAVVVTACVQWRLLTSMRSASSHKQGYEVTSPTTQISPGKDAIFLSIYLLHLLSYAFDSMDSLR